MSKFSKLPQFSKLNEKMAYNCYRKGICWNYFLSRGNFFLLCLLPKLIRKDDEIQGAIIAVLSGIVATKDDIKELIQMMNQRFEMVIMELADQRRVTDLLRKFIKKRLNTLDENMNQVRGFMEEI